MFENPNVGKMRQFGNFQTLYYNTKSIGKVPMLIVLQENMKAQNIFLFKVLLEMFLCSTENLFSCLSSYSFYYCKELQYETFLVIFTYCVSAGHGICHEIENNY